jgi:diguanylate cyclase (GGDEF)-like protein
MAEHIAMALSNLRLHETLRSQSIRDPMTGLFNRRFMEESLELELRRATRGQNTLGIIMVDMDRFRDFNQTYGREAGDSALRELGTLLQANVRKEDIACRFAGQRFAVIMPQGTLDVTHQRAAMLLELARGLHVKLRSQVVGNLQFSLGVSVFPQHGRTVDSILRAAEAALQRAKEAGGDQVVTAQ